MSLCPVTNPMKWYTTNKLDLVVLSHYSNYNGTTVEAIRMRMYRRIVARR